MSLALSSCLGQASVSLYSPRVPTNLLHHGPQNRIQKTSRNMAARKGPRLYRLCELQLAASQNCLHFAETCTLIFVSGAREGCRVCHVHLSQLRGPRWRLNGFCFHLSQRRVCFLDLKKQEKENYFFQCHYHSCHILTEFGGFDKFRHIWHF